MVISPQAQAKLDRIKTIGTSKLQVIADFDGTLTYKTYNGKKLPSLIAILRDDPTIIDADYAAQANAMYAHYAPIEKNITIPRATRNEAMNEWYNKHFELLIRGGLTKQQVESGLAKNHVTLREQLDLFLQTTATKNIPLTIMSAAGLGGEAIRRFLAKHNLIFPHMTIVSNAFIWDVAGKAIGITRPIVHSLNKNYLLIDEATRQKNSARTHALLLGNNPGDISMTDNGDFETVLSIGFCTVETRATMEHLYDIVLDDSEGMNEINNIIAKLQ